MTGISATDFLRRQAERRAATTKAAAARRPAEPVEHKVYRYEFPDGTIYIGVTKMSLRRREDAHKQHLSVVGRRLLMFPDEVPVRTILQTFDDRAEAEAAERDFIRAIPAARRLNKFAYNGKAKALSVDEDWKRRVKQGYEVEPGLR